MPRGGRLGGRGGDGTAPGPSSILGPAGRWATRIRAAAEEATRPPHGESRGSGPGSRGAPEGARLGGAARAGGGPGVLGRQRPGTTLGALALSAEPPAVQGRPGAPARRCCDGKGPQGQRGCSISAPENQGEAEKPLDFIARMLALVREST